MGTTPLTTGQFNVCTVAIHMPVSGEYLNTSERLKDGEELEPKEQREGSLRTPEQHFSNGSAVKILLYLYKSVTGLETHCSS